MGLDVSLQYYKDFGKTKALEDEYEEESDKIWKEVEDGREYDEISKAERDEINKRTSALAKEMGVGEYGTDEKNTKGIEINSKKYPEHLFKIGYFRSSYNNGGFNTVMGNFIGKDLYYIFETPEEYTFSPDWKMAKARAKDMLKELKTKIKENGAYQISELRHNDIIVERKEEVNNKEEALKKFLEIKKKHKLNKGFNNFSNYFGEFYLEEPLKVSGIINGFGSNFLSGGTKPVQYLIYEDDEGLNWYVQALEIVIETISWVLSKKDPEKYYLNWSS